MTLSEAAWAHIRERHPEVSAYETLVKIVVSRPEFIFKGSPGVLKAARRVETHLGPKFLVVVYREGSSKKAIITAYFTSDLKRIRGELLWKA